MRNTPVSFVLAAGLLGGAAQAVIIEGDALAQSSTSGAVRGVITDKKTKEPVIGATVVVSSAALQQEQVVITDENGAYVVNELPPGNYLVTVYFNETPFQRPNVVVQVGKQLVVNVTIDSEAAVGGETIVVEGRAPIIDQGSTKTGPTITKEYTDNVPVGRTFGAVLGAAPGSQGDTYGISFSGSTSVENTYIIEGVNTTDTAFGQLVSNLPNEFVQETEVITGGYNAEFGRSTGGVINVVTKQGSNELKGSVFAYFTPGALVAEATAIDREGSAISSESNLDYAWDIGAELGGPIVKDKVWFHVGVNPSFVKRTTDRIISTRVDRNDGMGGGPDGIADVDPETGFTIVEEIAGARTEVPTDFQTIFYTGKINAAVSEDHQAQLAFWGNPRTSTDIYGIASAPSRQRYTNEDGAYDGSLKWTSKFADGKTQVDAVLGFHRGFSNDKPLDAAGAANRMHFINPTPFEFFDGAPGGEEVPEACFDPDPADSFDPCPVTDYSLGGIGFFEERTNDRYSINLSGTQRVKAAGYHTFKAGIDSEITTYASRRGYTGGAYYEQAGNGRWRQRTLLQFDEMGEFDCNGTPCSTIDALEADTRNRGLGAYVQDSWQIRPNFTVNAGLRWERQTGYVADVLQGQLSPEGEIIPEVAFQIDNMFAPRIGAIYDPTQEGRAKLFGHWGRFYESVPMDINVRAFGGEITRFARTDFDENGVFTGQAGYGCDDPSVVFTARSIDELEASNCQYGTQAVLGGGTEYVAPGLKGQFIQEIILGGEYELMPDFKIGANYVHRSLPVAIEDISTDGGSTYLIANPGEDFSDAATDLRGEAAALRDGVDCMATPDNESCLLADLYDYRAVLLDAVDSFDKPIRTYDAIQVTANQRFSKNALLMASYTYSRAVGNFPGLFSTETGQLDPNLTSMYDLADLMANRYGALGHDRPHNLKIDGFYQFDLKDAGLVVLGASFRGQSGTAQNTLGAHVFYGDQESYLLPRGSAERGPFTWTGDVKGTYGRMFGSTKVEAFIDIFNLFNNQAETRVDEEYTVESVNPVVGGDADDLRHAKSLDSGGFATPTKSANFGNTSARQAPMSVRFGLRVTF